MQRNDIQALRGWAVLLVVLGHSTMEWPRAGYLGVDIFFVISGFLITGMVRSRLERGTFSFTDFYLRRVKRLMPAAYVTLALTALGSAMLLTAGELRAFAGQLLGAVTFSANVVLWRQVGYFAGEAESKPLLHMWSLGLEEQYYLLLPSVLFLMPRRWQGAGLAAVTAASLGLCLAAGPRWPTPTFYLLPARLWELGFGSLAAVLGSRHWRTPAALWWPSVAALVALPLWPSGRVHPGVDAMAVCLATAAVILRADEGVQKSPLVLVRGLTSLGDISYSLYLVHWPLLALFANCWFGEKNRWSVVHVALLPAALLVSVAMYRWVEQPCRRTSWNGRQVAAAALLSSAVLLGVGLGLSRAAARPAAGHSLGLTMGLSHVCETTADRYQPLPECRNSPSPRVLVWGDSFAMHVVPGLAEGLPLAQATKVVCAPFAGISRVAVSWQQKWTRQWAEGCIRFNDSVLAWVKQQPGITTVVLAADLRGFANPQYQLLENGTLRPLSSDAIRQAVERTARILRAAGKRVVLIGPPPAPPFDAGACAERLLSGKLILGPARDCSFGWKSERAELENALAGVVPILNITDGICGQQRCPAVEDGQAVYVDAAHLSTFGSKLVARRLDLVRRVEGEAR